MKYRHFLIAAGFAGWGTVAQANCPLPMQILFSCTLENDARVEFCHEIVSEETASASSIHGDLKSYSFARGYKPAELYFTPSTTFFNAIDANAVDKRIYGQSMSMFLMTGYENKDYVYAAMLAVDDDLYDGFLGAELRIFRNADAMSAAQKGTEVARYFCKNDSIIADQSEFRP